MKFHFYSSRRLTEVDRAGSGILLVPFSLAVLTHLSAQSLQGFGEKQTASNFVCDPRLWAVSLKGLVLWQMAERQPDKVHAVQSYWPHHRQVLKSTPRTGNNLARLLQEPSTHSIAHTLNTTDDYWQRFSHCLMSGLSEHNYPWPNLKWALRWHTKLKEVSHWGTYFSILTSWVTQCVHGPHTPAIPSPQWAVCLHSHWGRISPSWLSCFPGLWSQQWRYRCNVTLRVVFDRGISRPSWVTNVAQLVLKKICIHY